MSSAPGLAVTAWLETGDLKKHGAAWGRTNRADPSGHLLHSFIDLNNPALSRFSSEERQRIGMRTCPGSDLGYSSEELLAIGLRQLTHPDEPVVDFEAIPGLLSGEDSR
jgi:hypothetical protein